MKIFEDKMFLTTPRKTAMQLGKLWVKNEIGNYSNPPRRGLKKGSPIGFSRSKKIAALASFLYPNLLSIASIARLAGTSRGTVDVWRTEEEFRRVAQEASFSFGRMIANTLEYVVERKSGIRSVNQHEFINFKSFYEGAERIQIFTDNKKNLSYFLLEMIPEFNEDVLKMFSHMILEKAKEKKTSIGYLMFLDHIMQRKSERISKEGHRLGLRLGMYDPIFKEMDKTVNKRRDTHLAVQGTIAEYFLRIIETVAPEGNSQEDLYRKQTIENCVRSLRELIGGLTNDYVRKKLLKQDEIKGANISRK